MLGSGGGFSIKPTHRINLERDNWPVPLLGSLKKDADYFSIVKSRPLTKVGNNQFLVFYTGYFHCLKDIQLLLFQHRERQRQRLKCLNQLLNEAGVINQNTQHVLAALLQAAVGK